MDKINVNRFNESLFGCFSDMGSCCFVYCVPYGTQCIQITAVDLATREGVCNPCVALYCCACIGGGMNRMKIRNRYRIAGSFTLDCCLWCYCSPCAACQEYREVKKREPLNSY